MIDKWVLEKLEPRRGEATLVVRDPLRLLSEADEGPIHRFGRENGFTIIIASTNLALREQLREYPALGGAGARLILIDRTPARPAGRDGRAKGRTAPPLFYPDLMCRVAPPGAIDIKLSDFLREETGDPSWPAAKVDDPNFARLMAPHLRDVLQAHANLRKIEKTRFSDLDFQLIVGYGVLGAPEAAFKKDDTASYWKIGFFGHENLDKLAALIPEAAKALKKVFAEAPKPFCWLSGDNPALAVQAFFMAAILRQYCQNWALLPARIDPALQPFSGLEGKTLDEEGPSLVKLSPTRAALEMKKLEDSLSAADIELILKEAGADQDGRFAKIVAGERYSSLLRSLALAIGLDDLLSSSPHEAAQVELAAFLRQGGPQEFIDTRPCPAWDNLKAAYLSAADILGLRRLLEVILKELAVKQPGELSLGWFREAWVTRGLCRLEYRLSALSRLLANAEMSPRGLERLPQVFTEMAERLKTRLGGLAEVAQKGLDDLNAAWQDLVQGRYGAWAGDEAGEATLTAHFLRRVLKPNWDSAREAAALFVFDGMRYDVWAELARPLFEARMETISDGPGLSLLPSETGVSRKAIFAGLFPESFDGGRGDDALLQEALARDFGYGEPVKTPPDEPYTTGRTAHYRAGNLEIHLFDLCDAFLHHVDMKGAPDGQMAPIRPLALIYEQHIKNVLDQEVARLIRGLKPGTKVFVASDHGFTMVGRRRLELEDALFTDKSDCCYLHAALRQPLAKAFVTNQTRRYLVEIPKADLRLPGGAGATLVFPRPGCALVRPKAPFNPSAFSHGGVSLQEMFVPMAVMRVRPAEAELFSLGPIEGVFDLHEGERASFSLAIKLADGLKGSGASFRVEASYRGDGDAVALPPQTRRPGEAIGLSFTPDTAQATQKERAHGLMMRHLIVVVELRVNGVAARKTQVADFSVSITQKCAREVDRHLAKILGLAPRK